jgi:hypothetical protein
MILTVIILIGIVISPVSIEKVIDHAIDRTLASTINHASTIELNPNISFSFASTINFDVELNNAIKLVQEANYQNFYQRLKSLKEKYPNPSLDRDAFKTWWQTNGKSWIEEFWLVIKEYRYQDKLEPYIEATKLLLECLNSGCYVQRETRQQIETSLASVISQLKTDQDELQRSLSKKSP